MRVSSSCVVLRVPGSTLTNASTLSRTSKSSASFKKPSSLDNCRFYHNPEMSFEQVNRSSREGQNQMNLNGSVCLSLAEGVMHDVFVSSIVGGGEFVALLYLWLALHPLFLG